MSNSLYQNGSKTETQPNLCRLVFTWNYLINPKNANVEKEKKNTHEKNAFAVNFTFQIKSVKNISVQKHAYACWTHQREKKNPNDQNEKRKKKKTEGKSIAWMNTYNSRWM